MKCPKCRFENPQESSFCGRCAARLEPPQESCLGATETLGVSQEELTTGSNFAGRYQVIEEIGQGGMGRVYKVHDTKIGEKIALKLIRPEVGSDKKYLERFSNELKLTRKIRHKNVCQMFDLGENEGTRFITMEYINGEDLRQLIRKVGRLSPSQAIAITRQVCDGLEEAHKLGVVHRDLKPQNIMLDDNGNARIMDFGIARSLAGKSITGAGVLIGTTEYMSPEQVEGKDIDQRSDIYSLGVVLYEMVTGQRPFDGETPLSVAHKHKYEVPEDPKKNNPQVPDDLAWVILKCLEKDKTERYQSAQALGADLAGIAEGMPMAEKTTSKGKGLTTRNLTVTFNIRKLVVPALAGVLVIAAVLIYLSVIGDRKAIPIVSSSSGKPSIAVMYFENQTDKPGLDKALVSLLTTNLSRFENIEVTSTQRLFDILKILGKVDVQVIDKSLATDVATRAGVDTMLLGSIIQIGGRIRLVSELIDVESGSTIARQAADGASYDDVFTMVDGITGQVGREIGGTATKGNLKVTDVTTSSLEALNRYLKGYDLILRWDFRGAEEILREATDIDPTFAMAYACLTLAQVRGFLVLNDIYFDMTEAGKNLEAAKRYSNRVTESERLFIQMIEAAFDFNLALAARFGQEILDRGVPEKWAYYTIMLERWSRGDFPGVIQILEKALENDPSDANSYNMIGYSYSLLDDYQSAISSIKKYMAVHPDVSNSHDGAWDVSMWTGRYDEALRYADEALRVHPEWKWFDYLAGWTLIHQGDGAAARERFRRWERNVPTEKPRATFYIGLSYIREGRFREAQAEFLRALDQFHENDQKYNEFRCRLSLGESLLIQGRLDEALSQFNEAEKGMGGYYKYDFNPVPLVRRFYTGRAFIRQGEFSKAAAAAEEISTIIERQNLPSIYFNFRLLLEADIELARNRPEEALRILGQVGPFVWTSSPFYWHAKAVTEDGVGRFEQAAKSYAKFLGFTPMIRHSQGEPVRYFYELSMVDYNLGRIAEKMNNPVAAKDHYRKFQEGMKLAGPGIPEIEDAKRRLATLE